MKKAISARIDEETLIYIKECHQPINTLINILLKKWIKDRQDKELLIWKEDTGQDEFSQMKAQENFKCSQCCKNCIHNNKDYCIKTGQYTDRLSGGENKFCCIYWTKKKGSH